MPACGQGAAFAAVASVMLPLSFEQHEHSPDVGIVVRVERHQATLASIQARGGMVVYVTLPLLEAVAGSREVLVPAGVAVALAAGTEHHEEAAVKVLRERSGYEYEGSRSKSRGRDLPGEREDDGVSGREPRDSGSARVSSRI